MGRETVSRRFFASGRVQGVGYRYFVERHACQMGLNGYVRNLDDGRVEVYASGTGEELAELARLLRQGPRWSDVRGLKELEAAPEGCAGFYIRD